MFERVFAENGLSLERVRAFLEVCASGSIVKAAGGDPVRQSQYSRQIKELEDFFRTKLVERDGKGLRMTAKGRELARISRFFMLGLSNFRKGCLAEKQSCRIGASPTLIQKFLAPPVSKLMAGGTHFFFEICPDSEIERRLHDLTLEFALTTKSTLSRPLQTRHVGRWKPTLVVPRSFCRTRGAALKAFQSKNLPLVLARNEFDAALGQAMNSYSAHLECESFLTARRILDNSELGSVLPDYLTADINSRTHWKLPVPGIESHVACYQLAWNPRLVRLNLHVVRTLDLLHKALKTQFLAA